MRQRETLFSLHPRIVANTAMDTISNSQDCESQLGPTYCSQHLNGHYLQLTLPWDSLPPLGSQASWLICLQQATLLFCTMGDYWTHTKGLSACGANTLLWAYMCPLTLRSYFRRSLHRTIISWLSWTEMEPKQENPALSLCWWVFRDIWEEEALTEKTPP